MGDFRGGAWSWAWARVRGNGCVMAQVPWLLVAPASQCKPQGAFEHHHCHLLSPQ